jgi:hypothetical protein
MNNLAGPPRPFRVLWADAAQVRTTPLRVEFADDGPGDMLKEPGDLLVLPKPSRPPGRDQRGEAAR